MVWLKHVGGGKSLVLWDSFAPHLEVSSSMDFDDVLTESMPPGCAIRLQPLLMGIKHKFKVIEYNVTNVKYMCVHRIHSLASVWWRE